MTYGLFFPATNFKKGRPKTDPAQNPRASTSFAPKRRPRMACGPAAFYFPLLVDDRSSTPLLRGGTTPFCSKTTAKIVEEWRKKGAYENCENSIAVRPLFEKTCCRSPVDTVARAKN